MVINYYNNSDNLKWCYSNYYKFNAHNKRLNKNETLEQYKNASYLYANESFIIIIIINK